MTDEQLANELRAAQAKVAECYKELKSRGWRISHWQEKNDDDDYYDDRRYEPSKPYVFKITKDKVVVPDREI